MLVFLHRDVKNLYFFSDLKKVLAFEEGWAHLPWKPGNAFWFKKKKSVRRICKMWWGARGCWCCLTVTWFKWSRIFGRIQGRGRSTKQKCFRLELLHLPCAKFTWVYFKACMGVGWVMGLGCLDQKNTHLVKSYDNPAVSAGKKFQGTA